MKCITACHVQHLTLAQWVQNFFLIALNFLSPSISQNYKQNLIFDYVFKSLGMQIHKEFSQIVHCGSIVGSAPHNYMLLWLILG